MFYYLEHYFISIKLFMGINYFNFVVHSCLSYIRPKLYISKISDPYQQIQPSLYFFEAIIIKADGRKIAETVV